MLLGRTPLGHKTLRDGTIIARIIEEDEPATVIDNGGTQLLGCITN
ncbi:hypothetical protein VZ212_02795 [Metamycoplasma hominis]